MALVLTDPEISGLVSMREYIQAMEQAYLEFGQGVAAIRPRQRYQVALDENRFHMTNIIAGHVEKDGVMPERLAAIPYEAPPWFDYSDSAETASRLVALKPEFIFGHYHIAIACAQIGQTDRARRAFREVLRINPNFDRDFVSAVAPYKDSADLEHELDGFRKAGWNG